MTTLLALDEQVQRILALASDIPGYVASMVASCPECGCLWDNHRTIEQLYESDDPMEMRDLAWDPKYAEPLGRARAFHNGRSLAHCHGAPPFSMRIG